MSTVAEVKALCPLADAYELKPEARYLFFVPRGENVDDLLRGGIHLGINGLIVFVEEPERIQLFDLGVNAKES